MDYRLVYICQFHWRKDWTLGGIFWKFVLHTYSNMFFFGNCQWSQRKCNVCQPKKLRTAHKELVCLPHIASLLFDFFPFLFMNLYPWDLRMSQATAANWSFCLPAVAKCSLDSICSFLCQTKDAISIGFSSFSVHNNKQSTWNNPSNTAYALLQNLSGCLFVETTSHVGSSFFRFLLKPQFFNWKG